MDCPLGLELAQTVYGFKDFGGRNKFDVVEVDNVEVGGVEAGEGARNRMFDPGRGVVEFRTADTSAFRYEVVAGAGVIGEDLRLLEGAAEDFLRGAIVRRRIKGIYARS